MIIFKKLSLSIININTFKCFSICDLSVPVFIHPSICPMFYLPICLTVCPTFYLPIYLSYFIYLPICLSYSLSTHLSIPLFIYPSVCPTLYPYICLSHSLSAHLSVPLFIHPSTILSIHLLIHLLIHTINAFHHLYIKSIRHNVIYNIIIICTYIHNYNK